MSSSASPLHPQLYLFVSFINSPNHSDDQQKLSSSATWLLTIKRTNLNFSMNSFQWFFFIVWINETSLFSHIHFYLFLFLFHLSTHLIPASSSSSVFFTIAVYNYKWFFIIIIYSLIYVQFDFFSLQFAAPHVLVIIEIPPHRHRTLHSFHIQP